jgi:hypothetical protein
VILGGIALFISAEALERELVSVAVSSATFHYRIMEGLPVIREQ